MPFVLRGEGDTENPILATVYGDQITEGMLVYSTQSAGRIKSIIFLGEGEMDGIDRLYHHGERIPEFHTDGSRIWKFHPGTRTVRPSYVKCLDVNTTTEAVQSSAAHGFSDNDPIMLDGFNIPSETSTSTQYYAGNVDATHFTVHTATPVGPGNVVNFQTSGKGAFTAFKSSGVGFNDPVQGRPEFFPDLNYTFSGVSYVEIFMTDTMSAFDEGGEPEGFKIMVRGRRLQNYDHTGAVANPDGIAEPGAAKFFSNNNALVVVDILLNKMRMSTDRIHWPSFVAFRDRCAEIISWDGGAPEANSRPTMALNASVGEMSNTPAGTLEKLKATNAWDIGAVSYAEKTAGNITCSGVYRGGIWALGFTEASDNPIPPTFDNYDDMMWSVVVDGTDVKVYKGATLKHTESTIPYEVGTRIGAKMVQNPSVLTELTFKFTINDHVFFSEQDTVSITDEHYTTPIRIAWAAYSQGAKVSELHMFPVTGTARDSARYTADVVFANTGPASVAVEQVMSRAPGAHWQDVNGLIKFITKPDVVTGTFQYNAFQKDFVDVVSPGDAAADGDRIVAKHLHYDPNMKQFRSNIAFGTPQYYFKPTEEKLNFVRIEYRDAEDEFYTKQFAFKDRPKEADEAESVIDSGIIPIGVATASLAERIAESILKFGTDLDLFAQVVGLPECYEVSVGDVIELSHDVPGWDIYNSKQFLVIEEETESSIDKSATKTLSLQIYDPGFYSDTDHGPLANKIGVTQSVGKPPRIDSLSFLQDVEQNGNETAYGLKVTVDFDTSYGRRQTANVYFRHITSEAEGVVTLTQTNPATETAEFEIRPAVPGTYSFRVVTQSPEGLLSEETYRINYVVEADKYPRKELLEWDIKAGLSVGLSSQLHKNLSSSTTTGYDNAYAYSTRAVSNLVSDAEISFTLDRVDPFLLSFSFGEETSYTDLDYSLEIGAARLCTSVQTSGSYHVTCRNHGLSPDQAVRVKEIGGAVDALPDPLHIGTTYYVGVVDANTITLHTGTPALIANRVSFTSNKPFLIFESADVVPVTAIAHATTDVCTSAGHGLSHNDGVFLGGAVATASKSETYYVSVIDSNTFTLHTAYPPTVSNKVDFTGDPSGTYIFKSRNSLRLFHGTTLHYEGTYTIGDTIGLSFDLSSMTLKRISTADFDGETVLHTQGLTETLLPIHADIRVLGNLNRAPKIYLYGNLQNRVGLKIHPEKIKNMKFTSTDDIKKISAAEGGVSAWDFPHDSWVFSYESLDGDGGVTFSPAQSNKYLGVGLAYKVIVPEQGKTQNRLFAHDYLFYLQDDGTLQIRENKSDATVHAGTYSAGDQLGIWRRNNQIVYTRNGLIEYQSSHPIREQGQDRLYITVDAYNVDGRVDDVVLYKVGAPIDYSTLPFRSILLNRLDTANSYVDWNLNDAGEVFFQLIMSFSDITDGFTNVSTGNRARVTVINKFGQVVKEMPVSNFPAGGIVCQGFHSRKYADPAEEAVYKVELASADNPTNFSRPVYLQAGNWVFSTPTYRSVNNNLMDLTGSAPSSNSVTLSWSDPQGVTEDVHYRLYGTTPWTYFSTANSPATVTGLAPDTYYEFKVDDSADSLNFTNIIRVKTKPIGPPAETYPPPSNLLVTVTGSTTVKLDWTANTTSNTDVQYRIDGGSWTSMSGVVTTYNISGLSPGTQYSFEVRNVYSGPNYSSPSETVLATTTQGSSGSAPSNLVAQAIDSYHVNLSWTNNAGTEDFKLERKFGGVWSTLENAYAGTFYVDSGVTGGNIYVYRVSHNSYSGFSNEASVFTPTDGNEF